MSSSTRHRKLPLSEQIDHQERRGLYQVPSSENNTSTLNSAFIPNASLNKTSSVSPFDNAMSARDRTAEFSSAVKMLQAQHLKPTRSQRNLRQRNEFIEAARRIGTDLGSTCSKLDKLALLVRNQSLFDDHGGEMEELQFIVKQDLAALAKQVGQLHSLSRATGQRATLNANVMSSLSSRLQTISSEFKMVLETRTSALKLQATRRDQFSGSSSNSSIASGRGIFHKSMETSTLLQDELNNAGTSRYLQQQHVIDQQDVYLQRRADSMRSIEQTVVELGGIFQTLSVMVKEQEEIVLRIDSHTEEAVLNVDAAHTELVKYLKSISGNRWLMLKIFGVVLLFFVIFVVFSA